MVRSVARYLLAPVVVYALGLPALRAQGVAEAGGYQIGPKDLLKITVFEVPALNVETRVDEAGRITLPLIGDIPAHELTTDQLAQRLKTLLEDRYVQRATVSVEVREFRSNPISVIGAVSQPGPLPYSGRWTLREVLVAAGGLTPNHGGTVYVHRRAENGLSDQLAIRTADLFERADASYNIPIFANDLIHVPAASQITIYLLGEISSPGVQTFKGSERATLLTVIAKAGGLTERASKKIAIRRDTGGPTRQEFVMDYKRILTGKEPDFELRDGDIVHIKESFF